MLESGRDGEFSVLEQEDSHVLTLGSLSLTLRPDRIDTLADGRRLVIDYKTGAVQRKSWLGERPADPQLPLYTLLDDTVAGLAFGRVHQDRGSPNSNVTRFLKKKVRVRLKARIHRPGSEVFFVTKLFCPKPG